jgi:branched-chain amino acid transport system ATP-binding protein
MPDPFLAADEVTVHFGGLTAVDAVSLTADRGEVVGVIGPNGAGKTTLFNALVGAVPCDGDVRVDGHGVNGWSPARRARAGLGRTFQRLELFGSMTVEENLRFATEAGALSERPWRMLARRRYQDAARADAMLDRLGMGDLASTPAADLPPGSARLLELGRALCTQPAVVLLDEPSSGLDVGETEAFGETLRAVVGELGVGIVLVEHDVSLVMRMCERLYVLEFGRCIASGPTAEVAASPAVQEAYLGDVGATS